MQYLFFTILILLIVIIFYFVFHIKNKIEESSIDQIEKKLNEIYKTNLDSITKQLILLSKQSLTAEKKEIRTDLENKRQEIEKMVENTLKELREAQKERLNLTQILRTQKELTEKLKVETESLKKILSNNQLRGQFGEQVAEDLLKMAGFVKGEDYIVNTKLETRRTRPDFSIFLPDGTKMNVDVKFPYAALQKAAETDDSEIKKEHLKKFEIDVKAKISQMISRDYIDPEEKTVDFVILFVPNEMIFSYIYDKMNEVWKEAMEKRVILAGPFSFTAILRLVRQAYENFRYQKNIKTIITHIKAFEKEFEKYNEEFLKIGTIISRLSSQYEKVSTTRTRQLQRTVDKIRLEQGEEQPKLITSS